MSTPRVKHGKCRCRGRGCDTCAVAVVLKIGLEPRACGTSGASGRSGAHEQKRASSAREQRRASSAQERMRDSSSSSRGRSAEGREGAAASKSKSDGPRHSAPSASNGRVARRSGDSASRRSPSGEESAAWSANVGTGNGSIRSWRGGGAIMLDQWNGRDFHNPVLEPNDAWIYMTREPPPGSSRGRADSNPEPHFRLHLSHLPPNFATVAGLASEAVICSSKELHPYCRRTVAGEVSLEITNANYYDNKPFRKLLLETVWEVGLSDPAWRSLSFEAPLSIIESASLSAGCSSKSRSSASASKASSKSAENSPVLMGYQDGRTTTSIVYHEDDSPGVKRSHGVAKLADVICYFRFDKNGNNDRVYDQPGYRAVSALGPPRLSGHVHQALIRKLYRLTMDLGMTASMPVSVVSSVNLSSQPSKGHKSNRRSSSRAAGRNIRDLESLEGRSERSSRSSPGPNGVVELRKEAPSSTIHRSGASDSRCA